MRVTKANILLYLHKRITRQIDKAELKDLTSLIDSDEQSQVIEKQVSAVWEASGPVPSNVSFDKNAAYDFFLDNVVNESTRIKPEKGSKTLYRILSVALLLCLAVVIYSLMSSANSKISLDDGTMFASNQAKISTDMFSSTNRHLEIASGEAFFEVAKDKDYPFTIADADFNVTVLGTSFIVNADQNEVKVLEGSVRLDAGNETIVVTTGQAAILIDGKFEVRDVDFHDESWISVDANFENIPFTRAIGLMEAKYRINLQYETDENLDNCPFTTTGSKDLSMEEMLTIVAKLYNGKLRRTGSKQFSLGYISCQ